MYAGYLIRFRPRPNELLSGYLELFTHAEPYHRWVASMFRAGTQPNINASEYASMHIPPPAVVEQKAIAGAVEQVTEGVVAARIETDVLTPIKAVLSRALLSGSVRAVSEARN